MGPTIALRSSGAVPADEEKYADLHSIVANLAEQAGVAKPGVHVIADASPNAFATGRGHNNSHVAVTTGLLAMLDRGELEGVLAHEMTHIKNRDILVMTAVVAMSAVLSTLANMAMYSNMSRDRESHPLMMAVGVIGSMVMPFAMMIIQMSISI